MQPLEARVHSRAPFVDKVSVIAHSSAAPLRVWSQNISEGGLSLQTGHPFRRGDRVGVRIPCLDTELSIPNCEVSWVVRDVKGSSRAPSVGLRFLQLRPNEQKLLRQLVHHQQSAPDDAAPSQNDDKDSDTMHSQSLPPLAEPALGSLSPTMETLPPDDLHEAEPSLAPLPAAESAHWEFSDEGPRAQRAARGRRSETGTSNFAVAAILLVAGTVAGMIFGLLDQSAKPRSSAAIAAQAPSTTVSAEPTPEPAIAPAATEKPVAAAMPSVAVAAPAPAKKSAPVVTALAPAPKAEKKIVTPALPLPNHRPGRVMLGAFQTAGDDLILPIRGVLSVEKQFVLKAPDRVVLDLAADVFEGMTEMRGMGAVKNVRIGRRPGGLRLVLDVANPKVAAAARVTRRNGVLSVVIPMK